jgi:hypothetical protein
VKQVSSYVEALRYHAYAHSRDARTHRLRAEQHRSAPRRARPHQHNTLISGARAELALWHLRRSGYTRECL